MKSQKLDAEEVVAWGNALRELKAPQATVGNHSINSPFTAAETLARDLEPLLASARRRGGVVHFGEIRLDRTLMRRSNWVIWVIGTLWASNDMLPVRANGVARLDVDDGARSGSGSVTSKVGIGHCRDGVVGAWCAKANEKTLVGTIDKHFLEDGMRIGSSSENERRHDPLHVERQRGRTGKEGKRVGYELRDPRESASRVALYTSLLRGRPDTISEGAKRVSRVVTHECETRYGNDWIKPSSSLRSRWLRAPVVTATFHQL